MRLPIPRTALKTLGASQNETEPSKEYQASDFYSSRNRPTLTQQTLWESARHWRQFVWHIICT